MKLLWCIVVSTLKMGGFKISDEDKITVGACEVVVSTSAFVGGG